MSALIIDSVVWWGRGFSRALVVSGLAMALATPAMAQRPHYMLQDIGTLGGPNSAAVAMNDHGVVVGWSDWFEETAEFMEVHAFAWDNGRMIDLRTLGGDWAVARDVNNRGEIVGVSRTKYGETHAFYAFRGVMYDMNGLVAVVPPDQANDRPALGTDLQLREIFEVNGINDEGHIIGCGTVWGTDEIYGFLFIPVDGLGPGLSPPSVFFDYIPLGRLPGTADCLPLAINDHDAIVGESGGDAFYWDQHIMRLDDVTKEHSCAMAVNNDEHAVGWALDRGNPRTTRWFKGNRITLEQRDNQASLALDVNESRHIVGWMAPTFGDRKTATVWFEGGQPVKVAAMTEDPGTSGVRYTRFNEAVAIDEQNRIAGTGTITFGRSRAFILIPQEVGIGVEREYIEAWYCGN